MKLGAYVGRSSTADQRLTADANHLEGSCLPNRGSQGPARLRPCSLLAAPSSAPSSRAPVLRLREARTEALGKQILQKECSFRDREPRLGAWHPRWRPCCEPRPRIGLSPLIGLDTMPSHICADTLYGPSKLISKRPGLLYLTRNSGASQSVGLPLWRLAF